MNLKIMNSEFIGIHQWSDRRKLVDTVLLPMMVFVHVTPKERMEVLSFSTVSRNRTTFI